MSNIQIEEALANEFGVGPATIDDIRKINEKILKKCIKNNESLKSTCKTLKTGEFAEVENALCLWLK